MSTDNNIHAAISHRFGVCPELFEPGDNAAILVRNRATGETIQRITKAETIAGPNFKHGWRPNAAGSDMYVGMNPIKEGAYSRTKENIKDIRHVYLDLDRKGTNLSTRFEIRPKSRHQTLCSTLRPASTKSCGK